MIYSLNNSIAYSALRQEIGKCGLNILQLNEEQVFGLQHTELNFDSASFHTPYSVMFVEIPPSIGVADADGTLPQTVIVLRDYDTKNTMIVAPDGEGTNLTIMVRNNQNFEEIITYSEKLTDNPIKQNVYSAIRVAILALDISCDSTLERYNHDSGIAKEAIRRLSTKLDKKKWSTPESRFFKFNQNLKTFHGAIPKLEGNITGIKRIIPKRKGHKRNQPYGPKSSLRKKIWILPYFNKLLVGDKINMSTVFTFNHEIDSSSKDVI
jgi:hypothetical protein